MSGPAGSPLTGDSVYASAASAYRRLGWTSPLPLPAASKKEPPPGFTGSKGRLPDDADIAGWCGDKPDGNLALRLPPGVLVLDVDDYDGKEGGRTLKALKRALGPLPPTYMSTNRKGTPSGHLFFRVPEQIRRWKGELTFRHPDGRETGNIDLIHCFYRYSVAPPSVHPEGRIYEWIGPDGTTGPIPRPEDLPALPESWLGFCMRDSATARTQHALGHVEPRPLLAAPPGEDTCDVVLAAEAEARTGFASGGRHATALHAILVLLRLGQQDHQGVNDALDRLKVTFVSAVDRPDAAVEWDRAVAGALQQVRGSRSQGICSCGIARFRVLLQGTAGFSPGIGGVGEREVLRHFVNQAERTGRIEVRLSLRQMAELTRKPHQSVHRIVERLAEKQWLIQTRRPGHGFGTTYRISVPDASKVMTARKTQKAGSSAVITSGASAHFLFSSSGLGRGKAETLAALDMMGVRLARGRFLVPTGRSSTSKSPRMTIRGRLPEMKRMVHGEGKTAAEIARVTGKAASTVSSHLKDLHARGLVYKDRKRRWWGLVLIEDRVADELGVPDLREELQQRHRVERMYFTLASALKEKSAIQVVNDGQQWLLVDTEQGTVLWTPETATEAEMLVQALKSHGISLPDVIELSD